MSVDCRVLRAALPAARPNTALSSTRASPGGLLSVSGSAMDAPEGTRKRERDEISSSSCEVCSVVLVELSLTQARLQGLLCGARAAIPPWAGTQYHPLQLTLLSLCLAQLVRSRAAPDHTRRLRRSSGQPLTPFK